MLAELAKLIEIAKDKLEAEMQEIAAFIFDYEGTLQGAAKSVSKDGIDLADVVGSV